jgi:hypothetical protein
VWGENVGVDTFLGPLHGPTGFHDEAAAVFGGDIVVAEDLARIPMPTRRPT